MDTQHRSDTGRIPAAGQHCQTCGERPADVIDKYGDAECHACVAEFGTAFAELRRLTDRVRSAMADAREAGLPEEWIDWGLDEVRAAAA